MLLRIGFHLFSILIKCDKPSSLTALAFLSFARSTYSKFGLNWMMPCSGVRCSSPKEKMFGITALIWPVFPQQFTVLTSSCNLLTKVLHYTHAAHHLLTSQQHIVTLTWFLVKTAVLVCPFYHCQIKKKHLKLKCT